MKKPKIKTNQQLAKKAETEVNGETLYQFLKSKADISSLFDDPDAFGYELAAEIVKRFCAEYSEPEFITDKNGRVALVGKNGKIIAQQG